MERLMADVTGGTPPTGSSPFRPPDDFKDLYDHFGDGDMFSVATASALPGSGNWPGRVLVARDTGVLYLNPAGNATWVVGAVRSVGSPAPTIMMTGRTSITTDASGAFEVTFPTAFPTACDAVLPVSASTAFYTGGVAVGTRTATNFTGRIGLNSGSILIDWVAYGR